MGSPPIYMDHHATTPVDKRVLAAMEPYLTTVFGNAASVAHEHGRLARDAVERAREQIASLLHCKAREIIFTSGATESDNLAIAGTARALQSKGRHLITVRTEHKAVLDPCAQLAKEGWNVTVLDVNAQGLVAPEAVASAITDDTVLISVMLANNEVGVLQDLEAIGQVAGERGVFLHCDAAQGVGYLPLSLETTPIDLVSLSGHKIYGPKGVGALYVRESAHARGVPEPRILGGGHERGLRSGTLNVPGIVGFGAAASIMEEEGPVEAERLTSLRDALESRLVAELDEVQVHGRGAPRHPGNLNMSFGYVDGARLLVELCKEVAVSSGAACSSAKPGPSYVLDAMGVPKEWAAASIRFGLGRPTTEQDVARVSDTVIETVNSLRATSPLWKRRAKAAPVDW